MKEKATLDGISLRRVGEGIFRRLCALFPQGHRPLAGDEYWAIFGVPPDDARLTEAIRLLTDARFTISVGRIGRCGPDTGRSITELSLTRFRLQIERTYSRADLCECELLELMGHRFYRMLPEDDPPNSLWVTPKAVRSKADFVQNESSTRNIIVPKRVRILLEAGRFRHLEFRPVFVSRKLVGKLTEEVRALQEARGIHAVQKERQVIPWEKLGEPWSEVWSDQILPPLSPSCLIMDHTGNPYRDGVSVGGQILHDGFYLWPEMHYRRSDLAKVDPFDIALTHERFDLPAPGEYKRAKVVSQRIYRYCIDNGLKANWRPIRIDEDL